MINTTVFNPTVAASAGGLVSTTADLDRFWQAVTRGQLLRPAQQAELHRTVLADPDRAPAVMQREMTLLDDLICG
jgi:D-alanyl-D-alanine carboxypeptidase